MFRKTFAGSFKPVVGLLTTCVLLFSGVQASASPQVANLPAGKYIVTFKSSASVAGEVSRFKARRGQVEHAFSRAIRGMAVSATTADLRVLQLDPDVVAIRPDNPVHVDVTQNNATWGLDRIDQADLPLNSTYQYTSTGAGVKVFVVDTGIYARHSEFSNTNGTSRVLPGFDAVFDGNGTNDCHGHGTHVSGTVAGKTYGVAKAAQLVPVRVLDCSGSGSDSGVIAGLDWVAGQVPSGGKAVVSMSLGGTPSVDLDAAVARSVTQGITVVVAAGNDTADACDSSPASAASAITVGATTSSYALAYYSNFGSCVDILAPGTNITSAGIRSSTAAAIMSGTSMATPHASGVVALMLEFAYKTPTQITSQLLANSVANTITGVPTGTVNKMLATSSFAPVITPTTQTITAYKDAPMSASTAFTASSFTSTPSYAITSGGALPAGLVFSSSTGVISGTPTVTQAATTYTITATAGLQTATAIINLTVSLAPAALSAASASFFGTVGTNMSTAGFTASNFVGAITYAITAGGALPAGLIISGSTGVISGIPTAAKTVTTYTITATGSTSGTASATRTLTVNPAVGPPGAATNVLASVSGSKRASVSWLQGAANGASISSQTVYVYNQSGLLVKTMVVRSGSTAIVNGLTSGVSYYFTVTSTNRFGTSVPSTVSNTIKAP